MTSKDKAVSQSTNAMAIDSLVSQGHLTLLKISSEYSEYYIKGTGCYLWFRFNEDRVAIVEPDFDLYCAVDKERFLNRLKPEAKKAFLFHLDLIQEANSGW